MNRLKPPKMDEIHVWQASLDVSELSLKEFSNTLSADEKIRADRFIQSQDRERFIAQKGILRSVLADYLAAEPGDLVFCRNRHGKPELAGDHTLSFNVSHSFDKLVMVFATAREVGVDLELVREFADMEQIIRHFFSPIEQREYYALEQNVRLTGFLTGWTRKEAYIKALGDNLHTALEHFSVSLNDDDLSIKLINPDHNRPVADWSLQMISPAIPGCIGAIVSQGSSWTQRSFNYDQSQ